MLTIWGIAYASGLVWFPDIWAEVLVSLEGNPCSLQGSMAVCLASRASKSP